MNLAISRRRILTATAGVAVAAHLPRPADARYDPTSDDFHYEVQRDPEDWRARLGDATYRIMREGGTEEPKSDPLWNSTEAGTYSCKGCDLPLFDAKWKVVLDMGWLFFSHAAPNSLPTGIDWPEPDVTDAAATRETLDALAMVEVHCRRCGSHQGHVVAVEGTVLHCINGASMSFAAADA